MPTRRHFLARCLGASALALAPARSRAAAAAKLAPWTFKLKPASLLVAPGYRVSLSIVAGSSTVLHEKIQATSPLTLPAKDASAVLPSDPAPTLTFQVNASLPNGNTIGYNDKLALSGPRTGSFTRTLVDPATGRRLFSYRAELILLSALTAQVELLQHEAVSS